MAYNLIGGGESAGEMGRVREFERGELKDMVED